MTSRLPVILAAVIFAMAASAAFSQSSYTTSTSVWDLQESLGPIALDSQLIYLPGTGVRLANGATSGTASFLNTDAPFPVNNVVGSWNVDMPSGTGIRIEIRAVNGSSSTPWYEIARQGTVSSSIPAVKGSRTDGIEDDTFKLSTKWPRIEYRVTLYTNTLGATPTLRLMSLCYADSSTRVPYVELSAPGYTTSLPVPWRSQRWSTVDPGEICGPTSMSQAMAYCGCNLSTETVAREDYDSVNDIYGNWPFIAQTAARHGFKSYYRRSNNQQFIRDCLNAGYPVEIGMAYSAGQLTNSPISSTDGHLVLAVGVTADGDYICNDCAGSDSRWDHVVYLKSEVATVWLGHGGTTIPCIPNNVYWRYPYFPYKSSDPISVNRAGKMEFFARSTNKQIYHMIQTEASGAWSDWTSMGGSAASDPVAVTNRAGGNAVFAVFTDGNLYYRTQSDASSAWSGWSSLGGPFAGKPAVGKSPDGRMDVFCRKADGSVWHRWQDTSGGWQAWSSIGGSVVGNPVVGLNWEGREEVFARVANNELYHCYQLNDGTWSGWSSLGGSITGDPSVGMTYDKRIEVYCKFTDGSTMLSRQNSQIVGTSWSAWSALPDASPDCPAVARTPGFLQDVYYRDAYNQLIHVSQSVTDGAYGSREVIGNSFTSSPIVGHNDDGTEQVFILQGDGNFRGKTLTSTGWSEWTTYGASGLFPERVVPSIKSVTTSPSSAAAGDPVAVRVQVTDNVGIESVTADGVALSNVGNGYWEGTITAASAPGGHIYAVKATDPSGNTSTVSRGYRTLPAVGLNTRALLDVPSAAISNYLFAVCGKVVVDSDSHFTLDDGGKKIDVYATGHGLTTGQMARARGVLTKTGPTSARLDATGHINRLD